MPRRVGKSAACVAAFALLLAAAASAQVASAQVPGPVLPDGPTEGLRLGDSVYAHPDQYREFRCSASEAFAGLTFCYKIRFERDRYGSANIIYSFLHTRAGTLVYLDRYRRPAAIDAGAAGRIMERLSRDRGEPARVSNMPQRPGQPDGIIAVWGKAELEPLDDARVAAIAKGQGQGTEFLVDFLGDAVRSAKERLPIYRLGGGPGFVWVASLDPRGNGFVRSTAVDASAFAKSR